MKHTALCSICNVPFETLRCPLCGDSQGSPEQALAQKVKSMKTRIEKSFAPDLSIARPKWSQSFTYNLVTQNHLFHQIRKEAGIDFATWAVSFPVTAKEFNHAASIYVGREVTRAVPRI